VQNKYLKNRYINTSTTVSHSLAVNGSGNGLVVSLFLFLFLRLLEQNTLLGSGIWWPNFRKLITCFLTSKNKNIEATSYVQEGEQGGRGG
jgi:hypothetical protein